MAMVTVRVLKRFKDQIAKEWRMPGDEFVVTNHRAEAIASKLPGYVEIVVETPDYDSMTNPELYKALMAMGITPPKRAKKAELLALLKG